MPAHPAARCAAGPTRDALALAFCCLPCLILVAAAARALYLAGRPGWCQNSLVACFLAAGKRTDRPCWRYARFARRPGCGLWWAVEAEPEPAGRHGRSLPFLRYCKALVAVAVRVRRRRGEELGTELVILLAFTCRVRRRVDANA